MQSCASNNGSPSKDAPYLNALSTRNFKCKLGSRYFTPIYKVKTGSVKRSQSFISRCSPFWSQSRLLKNRSSLRIGNHFPSDKAGLFPIFEHRKTSYFLAVIPHETPVVQNIKWHFGKSGNRVLSRPCRQIRPFSRLFLAIQTAFKFKFAASLLMNK